MKRTCIITIASVLTLSFSLNLLYIKKGSSEVLDHEKKVYRIAGDPFLPPFSYIDETGEFTGFNVELFKMIAKRKNIIIELIPMPSYKANESLKKGEIDAFMGMKYSSNMSGQVLFSDPYFIITDAIVVPRKEAQSIRTLIDLRNKILVMQEDPSVLSMIKNVRGSQIAIALNTKDAFNLLMNHRADGLITNKWTAAYYLEKLDADSQYEILSGLTGASSELTAVTAPDERHLLKIINTAMAEMKADGEYLELHSKWFGNITGKQLKELRFLITVLIVLVFIILAILFIIYLWNKKLKDQVKKRTAELEFANNQLRKQQMELTRADQFKETIFNHIYSGIITFDNKNNLTSINKRACSILNFKENQLVRAEDILSLPIMQQFFAVYQEFSSLAGKEEVFCKELEFNDKGKLRSVLIRIIPLNTDQMAEGYLITLADRSEERILEKKLALQEKMGALGRLVAGVAHEILNPLTTLKMFVDMLPKKYADPAFRDEMILHVPDALNRMNRIVENLLGYSRRHKVKREMFMIKDCLGSIISIMAPTLKKNGVQLVLNIDETATGYGDQNQIGQITLNFMINALDAMMDSTEKVMTITAFDDKQYACIKVADTGCGVDPEAVDHLFEPFYSTKPDGVGLGLSLCYQLAEENNGMVDVKMLDKGSEFIVKLPAIKKEET